MDEYRYIQREIKIGIGIQINTGINREIDKDRYRDINKYRNIQGDIDIYREIKKGTLYFQKRTNLANFKWSYWVKYPDQEGV